LLTFIVVVVEGILIRTEVLNLLNSSENISPVCSIFTIASKSRSVFPTLPPFLNTFETEEEQPRSVPVLPSSKTERNKIDNHSITYISLPSFFNISCPFFLCRKIKQQN
jgi:hypothetical protein